MSRASERRLARYQVRVDEYDRRQRKDQGGGGGGGGPLFRLFNFQREDGSYMLREDGSKFQQEVASAG